MIVLDSKDFVSRDLPLYFSYGEYEEATPTITVKASDIGESGEDFLLSEPIKQNLELYQVCDTADTYWFSDDIVNIISRRFLNIPAVEYIFLSMEDDLIGIMTVTNRYDKNIAESIYNAEYDLLETFKDLFFDFYIIYREDREIDDIWPQESGVIFKR
jgi:hypothetical protein